MVFYLSSILAWGCIAQAFELPAKKLTVVMKHALYYGDVSLEPDMVYSTAQLEGLCRRGFSQVISILKDRPHRPQIVECNGNTLVYQSMTLDQSPLLMQKIYESATQTHRPLAIVSYESDYPRGLAARALVQFCGWSLEQAAQYCEIDMVAQGSVNAGTCRSVLRARQHSYDAALTLAPEVAAQVCPRL